MNCYLRWIAQQYGMNYFSWSIPDPSCYNGQGDINEVGGTTCKANPSVSPISDTIIRDPNEAECIFPFTVDGGEQHNTCILVGIAGFTHPLFKCPVRRIKTGVTGTTGSGTNYVTNVQYPNCNNMMIHNDDNNLSLASNELVNVGYCPTNCAGATGTWDGTGGVTYTFDANGEVRGPNGEYELDPENCNCAYYQRLPVFSVCKNNCPGGL